MEFPNTVIRASAGSGKTFQLSNRYLGLVARGIEPETIFASTFTRKAAGEILYRILVRLGEAAAEEAERSALSEAITGSPTALSRDRILVILSDLVHHLHRLRVSTLDSFFVKIAQAFCFELEIPPGWTIADDLRNERFLEEAVRNIFAAEKSGDAARLMHLLTKGEVVRSVTEQALEIARKLIGFYRDARPDAWNRLKRRTEPTAEELDEAIRRFNEAPLPKHASIPPQHRKVYELLTAGNWKEFLAGKMSQNVINGSNTFYSKEMDDVLVDSVATLNEYAAAFEINRIVEQTEATGRLLGRINEEYESIKQRERALLFGDVTHRLAHPMNVKRPIAPETLAHRIDAITRHLLLDEFQDTSPVQWEVLRGFVHAALDAPPDLPGINRERGSFFCVGDVKQAIYGWRGGVADIFGTIEREIDGLEQRGLNRSWRSAPVVMETVNLLFGAIDANPCLVDALKSPKDKEAAIRWKQGFERHESAKSHLKGYCVLETTPLPDSHEAAELFRTNRGDTTARGKGGSFGSDFFEVEDENDENDGTPAETRTRKQIQLAYAVHRIAALHRRSPEKSIGVLTRGNKMISLLLYGLRRLGVDASEEGGNPLTDAASVELVLSAMTLADHPGDRVVRFHLAHSPLAEPLGLHVREATTVSSSDGLSDEATAEEVSLRIRERLLREGFGAVIQDWAKFLAVSCDRRELSRLLQLVEQAYLYDARADRTLRCDDFVDLIRGTRVRNPTGDKVRVMTIHQAKGLEFDIVVLPELDVKLTGSQTPLVVLGRENPTAPIERIIRYVGEEVRPLLPKEFRDMFDEQRRELIEESLCLLYVAMTRARHELVMIVPPPGRSKGKKPSSPRKTFDGILRGGLLDDPARDQPNAVIFECGDPQWYLADSGTHPTKARTTACSSETIFPSVLEIHLAPPARRPSRLLHRYRPSMHETEHELLPADEIVRPLEETPLRNDEFFAVETTERDRREAMLFGTAVHACFELVEWIDEAVPDRADVETVVRRIMQKEYLPEKAKRETESVVKLFSALCRRKDIREILSRHRAEQGSAGRRRHAKVFRERPFLISYKDGLMRGTIDRLVVLYEDGKPAAAEIIDFKTDRLNNEIDYQTRERQYAEQMAAYRFAVGKLFRLAETAIGVRLLFVNKENAVPRFGMSADGLIFPKHRP